MRRHLVLLAAVGLLCRPGFAAPRWVQVRSPHFVVFTDADEQTGRRIAGQLERMRDFFQIVLPNASAGGDMPITVLAFQDQKSFDSVVPAAYLAKGQARLAGFFSPLGDRNYISLETDARFQHPYAVIYHEYTHFILRKDYWLPVWLNEGMAQYFQNTDIIDTQVAFGQPDFNEVSYLSRRMQLIPLPILFKVDHNSPYYHEEDKTSVFYIESWALTHMLETADFGKRTHKIADYDHRVANGEDPVAAAQHAFGDLDALQKQLSNYLGQVGYQGIRLKMNSNMDDSSFEASPASLDQVDAVRADILTHVGRTADARTLAESILQRNPKDALALEDMGFITLATDHDQKAARKWFDQAVEVDPQSYTANFYAAVYGRSDPAAAASVEAHLRECIKLEPNLASPYNNLADLFVTGNRNLDEAHMLTIHAVQLDPQVLTFRYTAAEVLEAQHNIDGALMVLQEAKAHVARTPDQLAEIDRRIDHLKQNESSPSKAEVRASATK